MAHDLRREPALGECPCGRITSCFVLPDDRILTASRDGKIKLWSLLDLKSLGVLGEHEDGVESCAVRADGAYALSISYSGTVKLWDLKKQACEWTLPLGEGLCCGGLTPDGGRAVLGRADGSIEIYDTESRQRLETIRCTEGRALTCSIVPNGEHLVATFEDKTLRVFSLRSYKPISRLLGKSRFCCLATTSKLICAGDEDGSLWAIEWGADEPQSVEQPSRSGKKRLRKPDVNPFAVATETAQMMDIVGAKMSLESLRDLLAAIYLTEDDVRIVADDNEINVSWIQLRGSPTHMWHTLLVAARTQDRLESLTHWLLRRHPGNDRLIGVLRALELIDL